ncbi:MAG: flavin reductase family protein [Candidatus Thermoplasmatota archaeon]
MKETLSPEDGVKLLPHFPTVLIGTGTEDESNLITAAMIHVFSIDPVMLGTGISPKRHSFDLLKKYEEFTVNVPDVSMLEELKDCGSTSGRDTDKFEKFELTKEVSEVINVPGVKECPLILECDLEKEIETGDHHWFVGSVVNAKKDEDFQRDDAILYWGGEFRKPGKLLE